MTVTVTLLDSSGSPVEGKKVSLNNLYGAAAALPKTSDASGIATFSIKEIVPRSDTYKATDTTDAVVLRHEATVHWVSATAADPGKSTAVVTPGALPAAGSLAKVSVKLTIENGVGDPLQNVRVGITTTGVHVLPGSSTYTNSSGIATLELAGPPGQSLPVTITAGAYTSGREEGAGLPGAAPHDRIPGGSRSEHRREDRRQGLGRDGERLRGQGRSTVCVPLPCRWDAGGDLGHEHLHRRQLGLHRGRELRADHGRAGRHGHDRDAPRASPPTPRRTTTAPRASPTATGAGASSSSAPPPTARTSASAAPTGARAPSTSAARTARSSSTAAPRRASIEDVYGTDLYTDDTSVCSAAVHAGLITVATGGDVTIEIRPGAASYTGSTRHGVTSQDYDSWSGSYVFVTG